MKLINFATIVAVAGIGQVLAAPFVVVTTSNIVPSSNPHAIPHAVDGKTEFVGKMRKGPCGRNRLRQKAVEISNLFREALGLPLIKSDSHHHGLDDGRVRILPFIGTPNLFAPVHGKDANGNIKVVNIEALPHEGHHGYDHAHGRHHHHKGHHHFGKGSFINRINHSIMNLGRWEGRAVGFVLGCGIGVLLRMIFVIGVVMYRAVKGQRGEEQHEYSQITIIEEFVDHPNNSPPSYLDEKAPIVDESVQAPATPPSYVSENYPIVAETVKAPSTTEESK